MSPTFLPCGCAEGEGCADCAPWGEEAHAIARASAREAAEHLEAASFMPLASAVEVLSMRGDH